MKTLIYPGLVLSLLLLGGCASGKKHKEGGEGHHHHMTKCEGEKCETKAKSCDMDSCKMGQCQMYDKQCAYSVSHGDMHVKGKDEFKMRHKGHTYYFSSKVKMKEFERDLGENVKKANKNWDAFKWQQWR